MIRDRSFYRSFRILAGALILEQAVILSVNLADNVMIGAYSETALSAVAAVNQLQFLLQELAYGISGGLAVLASQYWGQRRTEPIKRLCAQALRLELLCSLLLFAAVTLLPRQIMTLFVEDDAVIGQGVAYLRIVRFSYVPFALTAALLSTMRSVENVRLALRVSLLSLGVNCAINYLLIFGRLGCPALGVEGAAIGTLTARCLELLVVLYYVLRRDPCLSMKPADLLRTQRTLNRDYLRASLPVIVQNGLWGVMNAVQTALLGHLAITAMTAYNITTTAYLLLAVGAAGAATAASILVGQQVGRGDRAGLRQTVNTLQLLFFAIGLALAGILLALRLPLLSLYDIAPTTRALAERFLLVKAGILLTMSYQMPMNTGVIRGGGNTRYGMILDMISSWLIVLPLTCLAAFVWHWSPVAVILCLNSDQVFKCVPAALYGNSLRWVRDLTRAPEQEHNS